MAMGVTVGQLLPRGCAETGDPDLKVEPLSGQRAVSTAPDLEGRCRPQMVGRMTADARSHRRFMTETDPIPVGYEGIIPHLVVPMPLRPSTSRPRRSMPSR